MHDFEIICPAKGVQMHLEAVWSGSIQFVQLFRPVCPKRNTMVLHLLFQKPSCFDQTMSWMTTSVLCWKRNSLALLILQWGQRLHRNSLELLDLQWIGKYYCKPEYQWSCKCTPGPGIYFNAFIHVYSPRAGAYNPLGTNVDVNRKPFSLCPLVASFKTISLKYDF